MGRRRTLCAKKPLAFNNHLKPELYPLSNHFLSLRCSVITGYWFQTRMERTLSYYTVKHISSTSCTCCTCCFIGVSLSESHTSGTALHTCVWLLACLLPYTVNFKWVHFKILKFTKIELVHSAVAWMEGLEQNWRPEAKTTEVEAYFVLRIINDRSLTGSTNLTWMVTTVVDVTSGKSHT